MSDYYIAESTSSAQPIENASMTFFVKSDHQPAVNSFAWGVILGMAFSLVIVFLTDIYRDSK